MYSLAQPATMRNAAIGALLSAAASYPRLAIWADRPAKTWLLVSVIFMASYILWSFVFGWHEKEAGRKVLTLEKSPRPWLLATLLGLAMALFLYFEVDPLTREVNPRQFPSDTKSWAAGILFTLGFEQLFVCFAPFAFFIRLAHRRNIAFVLTVGFGVLILGLQLDAASRWSFSFLALKLLATRAVVNSLGVWFYLRGGLPMAWWWVFVLNARHLFGFENQSGE